MSERARLSVVGLAALIVCVARGAPAGAAALMHGNVLVANLDNGFLYEYRPNGTSVQSFAFPDFANGFNDLRDIVAAPDGRVHAYNGTFTPRMTTLTPTTGTFTNQTHADWNTVNNVSYGGIGIYGNRVFVTDMALSGGTPGGVVMFSSDGAATPIRFGAGDYTDLTIGGDGLLYALGGSVDVFDPVTTLHLRTVSFDSAVGNGDIRGIAVSSSGTIYAAGWNGTVYAASATGSLLTSRATGVSNLTDIDLNDLGQLVIGSRFGQVILTDTTLEAQSMFQLGSQPTVHVAFTTPLTVPEPATSSLVLPAAILLLRRCRSNRA